MSWLHVIIWIMSVVFLLPVRTSLGKEASIAKDHLIQALESVEEMVVHLQEGHPEVFKRHAEDFLLHAHAVMENLPKGNEWADQVGGHLKAAISDAEEAIKLGASGQEASASNRALSAFSHTEEAYSLGERL